MRNPFLYSLHRGAVKQLTAIFVSLLVSVGAARADDADSVPFSVGEKLTYQIFWGPFVVGRATLEVAGTGPGGGHDCYHLVARAKTSGVIEWLFPGYRPAKSWLDRDGLFSRHYHEDRTEGKHHRKIDTHYDYAAKETVTRNEVNGHEH